MVWYLCVQRNFRIIVFQRDRDMGDMPSEDRGVKAEQDAQATSGAAANIQQTASRGVNIKKDIFNLPNMLTMFRVIVIPVVVYLLWIGTPMSCFYAVILFSVASLTDFFDGYLARRLNLVSITGKFLDPLADKLMVMATTVQLASMGWLESWIPIVILVRELVIQGLRSIASAEGLVIAAGTFGKLKTACQLVGLIGLLVHYEYPIRFFGLDTSMNFHRAGWYLLVLSIVFSCMSAVQYFKGFVDALSKQERPSSSEKA